jgi:hypothetical protein
MYSSASLRPGLNVVCPSLHNSLNNLPSKPDDQENALRSQKLDSIHILRPFQDLKYLFGIFLPSLAVLA